MHAANDCLQTVPTVNLHCKCRARQPHCALQPEAALTAAYTDLLQVPNTRYKPKTEIPDVRTVSAAAFMNHARAVTKKYGAVAGVNLANQHGTEGRLGEAYTKMVESLPHEIPFSLFSFDFHKECGAANYQYVFLSFSFISAVHINYFSDRVLDRHLCFLVCAISEQAEVDLQSSLIQKECKTHSLALRMGPYSEHIVSISSGDQALKGSSIGH
jgi:hypothetical protein